MYKLCIKLFILVLFIPECFAETNKFEFGLYKLDSGKPGPTLLIIGGIQGDEPGGFNAASLIVTQYTVTSGRVWIVPNLNFESIIKRSRGVHGDMNRKFKNIKESDPEFELVQKIKTIINDDEVDLIINLHDGSGFYRPEYVDERHNPNKWGQSLIIDQALVESSSYSNLKEIADAVVAKTNNRITDEYHKYFVKNTHTRQGNEEMEKTLTYYAVQNGKAAFGIEASKDFGTHERAYHHLLVIESFLDYLDINYERSFELTKKNVKNKIDNDIQIAMFEQRLIFDMSDVRGNLYYIPMKKGEPIDYQASNPLIAVLNNSSGYKVRYGNRHVTMLYPQYFLYDNSINHVTMNVDGVTRKVNMGDIVSVDESFRVLPLYGYRVNVIGFTKKGFKNEQNVIVRKKDIRKRYSIDKGGSLYRIEFYREDKFCGMILIDFNDESISSVDNELSEPAS